MMEAVEAEGVNDYNWYRVVGLVQGDFMEKVLPETMKWSVL